MINRYALAGLLSVLGCTLADPPDEGAEHVARKLTASDYGTNPPTSGVHSPQWARDGVYKPGDTPPLGTLVHTLEHGRIDIQYRRGGCPAMNDRVPAAIKAFRGTYVDKGPEVVP